MQPRRPKLWMHRTGRFWLGLGLLLFLIGCWVFTEFTQGWITYDWKSWSGGMEIQNGSMTLGWEPERNYITGWQIWFTPQQSSESGNLSDSPTSLEIPLWIFPLLWAITWPFWMARRDRNEAAHFAQLR